MDIPSLELMMRNAMLDESVIQAKLGGFQRFSISTPQPVKRNKRILLKRHPVGSAASSNAAVDDDVRGL